MKENNAELDDIDEEFTENREIQREKLLYEHRITRLLHKITHSICRINVRFFLYRIFCFVFSRHNESTNYHWNNSDRCETITAFHIL